MTGDGKALKFTVTVTTGQEYIQDHPVSANATLSESFLNEAVEVQVPFASPELRL